MCTTCGCSKDEVHIEGRQHKHDHPHPHERYHHEHADVKEQGLAYAPGLSQSRIVQIQQDILAKNNEYANVNRNWFSQHRILALNLVSSPGSGKTSLLTRTINDLKDEFSLSVIEGDQQTANDADRIRQTGVNALQINTGKGCHLDGHMVGYALESLKPEKESILFIENVGNLVCPASFDLGEAHKVAVLSVTEGEDKPLKYPDMFYAADLMLLNKVDLLPYLNFDIRQCIRYANQVNPKLKAIQVSVTSGEGMETWYQWIKEARQITLTKRPTKYLEIEKKPICV